MRRRVQNENPEVTERTTRDSRLAMLGELGKKSNAFRPAREVLRRVRAVRTIFPQYDHATRVNGHPIERVATVHGPSSHGKTTFTLGLGLSFLMRDHFFKLIDAERTTPMSWIEEMFGPYSTHPGFIASRPRTYEEAVAEQREFCNMIGEAKVKGKLPPDTTALTVVDSVRKLVPKGFFEKVTKAVAEDDAKKKGTRVNPKTVGVDGFGGRGAQIKAALNAAWLDELVPLLEDTGTALAFITRETDDPDADVWDKRSGEDFKIGGGRAIVYDSSLLIRIERAAFIRKGVGKDASDEEKRSAPTYGERHRFTIRKTKIAGKRTKFVVGFFHTSNGTLTQTGFDRARDVLELAENFEIVHKAGGWIQWKKRRWQGLDNAVKKITEDPELLAELESAVRDQFDSINPEEHDEDGVVD